MNLSFATPLAFLALAVLPALIIWELRGATRRAALAVSTVEPAQAVPATWRARLRRLPLALRVGALALLVVALARPQSGRADAVVPAEGIDIVLALDSSSSMRTAIGGGESRLAEAQLVLEDFVAGRTNDRLGLVVFRSRSFVLSPLTLDYSSFRGLLQQVDDLDLLDGTGIGVALADSLNLLRDSKARSRIVVLLTDGENNRPEVPPLTAARLAEALGVRVYTIGAMGGEPALPERLGVNEQALQQIADVSSGQYYRAGDPDTLADVYRSIDELERSRVGRERFAVYDELAPFVLVPALALLAVELLLRTFVLRRVP